MEENFLSGIIPDYEINLYLLFESYYYIQLKCSSYLIFNNSL